MNAPFSSRVMALPVKYPPVTSGTIIVWGLLASHPYGGMTWQALHYLVGLRCLGFDVWYVEDSNNLHYDPINIWPTGEYALNIAYLARYMDSIGLGDRWIFRPPDVWDVCYGSRDLRGLAELYADADAILNICGAHWVRPEQVSFNRLVYLQTDPFVDQVKVANQEDAGKTWQLDQYDFHFTYAENIGDPACLIPTERHQWYTTRPPVHVAWWDSDDPPPRGTITTISNWEHEDKGVVWQGETYYWRKDREFRRFIDLPQKSQQPLELALERIGDQERADLESLGWRISSAQILRDPADYRDFICNSLGEFTVAKDQYVRTRSGWFSDRSVCYLAAGRPVITQETGFSKFIPTGRGLFAFETMEDVLAAIDVTQTDPEGNRRAAREIAHEYFAADKVVGELVGKLGL
jgi:hypothetical protein